MRRQRVRTPLKTGVRVIDLFTPLCAGQRIGIFAGSGIGKSTLLAMLARSRGFDTAVLALVGERGREVRDFLEDALKQDRGARRYRRGDGRREPDDAPAGTRRRPCASPSIFATRARTCCSSSIRSRALPTQPATSPWPPASRRWRAAITPSVFSDLPKLPGARRAGRGGAGSITGVFSVLVDGDDHNDPVADSIRGTLDGHIVLERAIADQGRFPAVNVLTSVSRLAKAACTPEQRKLVIKLRAMIARFEDTRDLRLIGGYQQRVGRRTSTRPSSWCPRIYDAHAAGPRGSASVDVFQDVARALAAVRQLNRVRGERSCAGPLARAASGRRPCLPPACRPC